MQIKTAEIHIGRADDGIAGIADDALGVYESGRVLVNFDALFHEWRIKRLGQCEHVFCQECAAR